MPIAILETLTAQSVFLQKLSSFIKISWNISWVVGDRPAERRANSWFSHDVIKIKKQGIINPFEILVSLVIRASEDLSFRKFSV